MLLYVKLPQLLCIAKDTKFFKDLLHIIISAIKLVET